MLPETGIARTDAEVRLESVSARALAQGMEIDNRSRTLKLGRVSATYQPRERSR